LKRKTNIKLELSDKERKELRKHKIKKSEILEYSLDELAVLLKVSIARAREIYALADFQQIPSLGIEAAKDLIFLGFHSIDELNGKIGAELTDLYEKKKGYKTDPCVEDQFRLAVDFATNRDYSKKWWHFTNERKRYRAKFGYPKDRPEKMWTELLDV
jgi:hypothetical protein